MPEVRDWKWTRCCEQILSASTPRPWLISFSLGPESTCLTISDLNVQMNVMRAARLQSALERLTAAIRDVENELTDMKAEHDPLASHIFVSRRRYRNANDTKAGKRREMNARLSFNTACELGFRGSLDEWERLLGAVAKR